MKRRVNKNNNRKRKHAPPPPPGSDVIASRTRRKIKAISAKWDLQTPIIIEILNWLDQESLMNATLVSKQLHKIICDGHGIKNRIIPVFEISPTNGSTSALVEHIFDVDIETKNKMRRCLHMKVNGAHKFDYVSSKQIKASTKDAQMDWILSLDMSLPIRIARCDTKKSHSLLYGLSLILPNLREINLSNISGTSDETTLRLHCCCPHLERITWNNSTNDSLFVLLGGFRISPSNNIKEIITNDSSFYCTQLEMDEMSDLENHRDTFIFHYSKALERVSIRNVKWRNPYNIIDVVPQDALIKFVRNAPPTLRYFRSDLTQDNMTMLRLERSEIELLN